MGAAPKVSLLVPIYNVERYLRECLDSARDQTLQDIEIICINDGSTDGSRAIIQEYLDADPRFKVIDKSNSGYGNSMNLGLRAAAGEYIGILESDDFLDLDCLEVMYEKGHACNAEVVRADFYLYWSVPEPRKERFYWVDAALEGRINPQIDREVFFRKSSIWAALYRRDFLENNNIDFLETPGASYQDTAFNFKVWANCTDAVLINKAWLHYRQDNESSSVNSPGKVFCVCDEYEEMDRYLRERNMDKPYLRAIISRMRVDNYEWNYDRLNTELRREFLPRMRDDYISDEVNGYLDEKIFDPVKVRNRRLLIKDPKLYMLRREAADQGGRRAAAAWLLKNGGLGAFIKYFVFRFTN